MAPRRPVVPALLLPLLTATALVGSPAPAAAATISAATHAAPAHATSARVATSGPRFVDITSGDVVLKANVVTPTGSGRYPALIMPSSWGLNDLEYVAQAIKLAERGYVVVSYTPRGWWFSEGEIDTAGPKDLADLSRIIDWTLANTPADPARVGAAGISYGAGISVLGAAHDKRIRAVGVMSGWADMVSALYADQTRHRQAGGFLKIAADTLGNPSAELSEYLDDFAANRNVEGVSAWAKTRSPATYVDALNANGTAVLIANGWGDTFFPPNQIVDFYQRLTVPKRLELRPGDHAIPELTGLIGLSNEVWTSLYRWFDLHLRGISGGVDLHHPVSIKPYNAATENYADWPAVTDDTRRYGLGAIRTWDGTGLLGGAPSTGWSKTLPTDRDTTANGGIAIITNGIAAFTGKQPWTWLPTVDRSRAGVWASERPSQTQRIRGIPKLHLDLTGTEPQGTVVAYLYDLDPLGGAGLITHSPTTWLDTKGGARTVDLNLSATAYDLPAGHSLTLVIDTVDGLYYDENEPRKSVTVAGGSYLDVPLG
ncbi:CocE/NonD family hydrolase [Actinoplanes sp. NPDC051346]|uniref:CocE/NonD family hydrolase n=1 Tax=Actinoplanes sp. NPDC051346 TaxID=3155048 RepID=UPI003438F747